MMATWTLLCSVFVIIISQLTGVLPVCPENYDIRIPKTEQVLDSSVHCFNTTTPCTDLDNDLNYTVDLSGVTDLLSYDGDCLTLLKTDFTEPKYCFNVTATEINVDPPKSDDTPACIIFNEVPTFGEDMVPGVIDLQSVTGATVIIQVPVTTDPDAIQTVTVTSVEPSSFGPDFSVGDPKQPFITYIVNLASVTNVSSVSLTVSVMDDGYPVLSAEQTFSVLLVNDAVTCTGVSPAIYIDVDDPTDTATGFSCLSSAGNTLTYSVTQLSGGSDIAVTIDSTGTVSLASSTPTGFYDINVEATSIYSIMDSFNITVGAGRKPSCTIEDDTLVVRHNDTENTVYSTFVCVSEGENEDDINFDIADGTQDNFFNTDSSKLVGDDGSVSFTVNIDLDNLYEAATFPSVVTIDVSNVHGTVSYDFTVSVINMPPVLTLTDESTTVQETAVSGETVYTFTASDIESSDSLVFSVKDAEDPSATIPFSVSTPGVLTTSGGLNATLVSSYLLTVTVTDPEDESDSKNFTVEVVDVNETPQCNYVGGVVTVEADITTPVNQSLLTIDCFDTDAKAEYTQLTYVLSGVTVDFIGYFGFMDPSSKELILLQSLESVSVADVPSTAFTVTVSDQATAPLTVDLAVTVNFIDKKPICSDPDLQYEITEKTEDAFCFDIPHTCTDPTSVGLNFHLSDLTPADGFKSLVSSFNLQEPDESNITICLSTSLDGQPGTYKANLNVSNSVMSRMITLTIEVSDVNDPPVINNIPTDSLTVSESASVADVVVDLDITDRDPGANGNITYTFEATDPAMTGSGDFQLKDNGIIEVAQTLNASKQNTYTYTVTATDGGGLSESLNLTITIEDVDQPPQCEVPGDFSVNATAEPGFVIGTLICWDSDITPAYKTISFTVRSDATLISIAEDGTITLLESIPYYEDNLVYTVTVSNEGEGDSMGPSINLTVTIIYNKDFPPSCNASSLAIEFVDTDTPGCGVGKVNCTSPVQTVPSYSITTSTLTDNFRVETEEYEFSLSLRICTQDGFKDDIGTFQVVTSVTNDLGNVPITWDVTVTDINEAPYFQNDSYYWELPENTPVGTTFAVFEKVENSEFDPNPHTWDGLLLIQAKDPDVKTPSFQITNVADIGSYQWKENDTRIESSDIPLVYSFGEFFVNGTLDVSLIYIFQIQVLDQQGLSASVDFTINVTDVNVAPSCNVTSLTFDLSLKVETNTKLDSLFCINDDYDEAKKQIVYTLDGTDKEYFSINNVGEIWTGTQLPRDKDTLQFQAVAVDGENSSLNDVIDVFVNVNRSVSVECNPVQEPPPVWVINSCIDITLNCVDPVADGASTIGYNVSGNYEQGFTLAGDSGVYKLCYTKTSNGSYQLDVEVDNGLLPATVNVVIDVVYLRSTPTFDQLKYEVNVSESAGVGEPQLTVNAVTAGEFAGTIAYTILDYTPTSTSSFFSIDGTTGEIKPDKDLSELIQTRVFTLTLTVQATDNLSALKSTVKVQINIQEVNLVPQCQDVADTTLDIDASLNTVVATLQCTDDNVQDLYNTIVYSLDNDYFGVDADGVVSIKEYLPLITNTHVLKVTVSDGGLSIEVTVIIYVEMLLKPDLQVTEVTTTSVTLAWTFTRDDYSDIIKRYLLNYALGDESVQWLTIPNTATEKQLIDLEPGTQLLMYLYADTNFGNATSAFFSAETAILTKITIRYKDKNEVWDPDYNNRNSDKFKTYAAGAKSDLMQALNPVKGFHEVNVIGLSKGSVYVDAVVAVNQTGNISVARETLQNDGYSGNLGGTEVEGAISIYHGDKYIVVESISLSQGLPSALNEGVNVTVKCPFRMVGEGLTPRAKWTFNDIEITSTDTGKFTRNITQLDTDVFGYVAMLNIRSLKKKDEGVYACEVTSLDGELEKSRSLHMSVVQKPTVDLRPLTNYVESGSQIELNCTVLSGGEEELEFKWVHEGSTLNNPPVTEVSSKKQTLTIASARSNGAYYCQASNVAGSHTSETSNIYIISSDDANCPSGVDAQGTEWPPTPVGSTVKLSCPEGYQGTVTRECSSSGEWLDTNYSSCKQETLLSLQEEVDRLEDGIVEKEADEIIDTLANVTSSKPLVSGDIDLTINIMERVVNDTQAKQEIHPEFVKDVVTTADNMLKLDKEVWEEREQEEDSNGVTTVMKSLDAIGQEASLKATEQDGSTTNESLTVITTERLVLAYGTSLKNIEFPGEGSDVPKWIKDSKNKVFLDKDSFSNDVPADGKMGWSVIYYATVEKLLEGIESESAEIESDAEGIKRRLNSKIVSFSLNPHIRRTLTPPVRLTFEHANNNFSDPKCSYLSYQPPYMRRAKWSSEGCVAVALSENSTVCECDHLTNFAILMSPGSISDTHLQILSIISAVGCGISILFLVITILIYCCLWRYVKSDRAIILINLCIALIIAYSIFLGGVTQTENKDVCTAISALLHYFFLVVFFLMLAEGVEVLVSVVYVFNTRSRLTWLLLLSWGVPLVVVGVSLGVTKLEGYGNDDFCWLSLDNGLLWAFVAPALLVIVANLVIICIVLRTMFSTTAMMTKTNKEKGKAGLKAICVLLPLMGVTWVFGVFSVNNDLVVFQYLFAVFNSLQGFFIFVFHCIVSRQVRDGMRNRRRRYRAKSFKTTGTESSSQIPASKLNSTSEEEKPINDLDKKIVSPFIDADRQVQQLANKLYPSRANMKDEPKSPKEQKVVPPVDPSDIKLHNVGEIETSERWLTDGHVLLTDEPSIEENDAVTIGSPSTRNRKGAPPSPVKKNAWGEGKKAAPVHFPDYKLGETPQKKAGQLPPLKKKPSTNLVDHYGPPPPDILADPKIQNWRNQEEKIRESRDRLDQVYISQEPVPLHQDNRPRKPSASKKSSVHSQKSRSSTSSGGRRADPVEEDNEEVETIHLYEQRDMPLYRGVADEPRPARPRSYGERKKRQQKYNNYEPPRVMVNSEEDLSRYGRRQPFGGIRTTANAGVPGLGRPRHQEDIRWQNQNYPYQW